ncbi:MAG: lipoprotein-releasing system ATP-binding protein [Candidatus Binatota bacterium]|jgi:lipoprotein-releasing system ATP-binding protein|nr:lipoprotein-releasing system ATP-binding protein [Candidatus Binatota bacterium]
MSEPTAASAGDPLVRVEGLVKHYADAGRDVRVLEGVELEVQRGEKVAIVGESGVGKSTLLHILGALDRPTAGAVRYGGLDVATLGSDELAAFRNRQIGFVFQFHHLLGDFSALENVMMPALVGGERWERAADRAREILVRVGLGARLDHKPGELSGGEQQRVSVARAASLGPPVLLADEPTGNLDPITGEEVQDLLIELNRERSVALIIATHNPRLAAAMDRVLRLHDGRLEPA